MYQEYRNSVHVSFLRWGWLYYTDLRERPKPGFMFHAGKEGTEEAPPTNAFRTMGESESGKSGR